MTLQWIGIASKLAPTKAGPYFRAADRDVGLQQEANNQQRHAYATADGYRSDGGLSFSERGCAGIECGPTVTR